MSKAKTTSPALYLEATSMDSSQNSYHLKNFHSAAEALIWQVSPTIAALFTGAPTTPPVQPSSNASHTNLLQLNLSPLRLECKAGERIFAWRCVNTPPKSTIDLSVIIHIVNQASHASLHDTSSYGSGLQKFHIFCNIFLIPELQRLPALFKLLNSFVLWAGSDSDFIDPSIIVGTPLNQWQYQ